MSYSVPGIRVSTWAWLRIACFVALAHPANGQSLRVSAPNRASAGREVAFYVGLEQGRRFDGAVLAMPRAWTLVRAVVVGADGGTIDLEPWTDERAPGRIRLDPTGSVREPTELRLHVRLGHESMDGRWSLVPLERAAGWDDVGFVVRESGRVTRTLRVDEPPSAGENRVLRIGDGGPPVPLDGRRLPDLGTSKAWTLETWFRTVAPGAVLVSTWDGDEATDYPAELVIDPVGRLVFFQGRDGRHRSLRGPQAVADGGWHHVAVTHDPDHGWTRLLVDGAAVDSLYGFDMHGIARPGRVVLGSRVERRPDDGVLDFAGEMDEFRVWAASRTSRNVRDGMSRPMAQPPGGALILGFDRGIEPGLVASGSVRALTVGSDLTFRRPVRDLAVRMTAGYVQLSWSGDEGTGTIYHVERSADGALFEPVARYTNSQGSPVAGSGSRSFRHGEHATEGRVAWYRVRQVEATGAENLTPVVKVGGGSAHAVSRATLEGAWPNPFNPNTTIGYRVDRGGEVAVSVWDLSGQRVRMLADAYHEPGGYTVPFAADELPSGAYFVRLETVDGIQIRQIVLAK
jgi:hypothetical protein